MPPLITLIPNSGVQFWDVDLDIERLPRLSRSYWEEKISSAQDAAGTELRAFRELVSDEETGTVVVRGSRRELPFDAVTYVVGRNQAIEMHLGKWVPLPYFLLLSRSGAGRETFDRGPSNWARGRLAEHPTPGAGCTHRLTLAFDTALLPRVDGAPFVAPSPENSTRQAEFVFAANPDDNAWLINENWIGDWLHEMLVEMRTTQRAGRALRPEDLPYAFEHYARYQVLLALLDTADALPRVRLFDSVSANTGVLPVAVDLVLDIGNARTCGILIEEHPGQGMNLSDSYPLALRDLGRPELIDAQPFDSRVEFCRASFGRDAVSRRSGRASAFAWPSPVRVGPEAVRLAGARQGNEGITGLSSPKRYLWDDRLTTQGWRYNGRATDGVTTDPPVSGSFMQFVSEKGDVLVDDRGDVRRNEPSALRARFSRSSMFTFMLTEILLQALAQINAPGTRGQRRDAEKPRQMRAVLMTMPPGMPVREQRIMRTRAEAAVTLAWNILGWTATKSGGPLVPRVVCKLDEATATQIVWLHNEVTERLQGDVGALMEMIGRVRPEVNAAQPCLRVASVDIGGGTTDLMVTTYTVQGGEAILPYQEFRESFKIAGDDVLERVISTVIVPCLSGTLRQSGVRDPNALLSRTLGQDQGGQSEQERHLRRLFVSTVLEPCGIAVLHLYEQIEGRTSGEIVRAALGDILGPAATKRAARAFGYFDDAARAAGAQGYQAVSVEIAAETRQVESAIQFVLGPVLADLCEVIWTYDCDVLLLSGRPSRLRAVGDIVLAKAPVSPHRVISMHRYRVGENYPYRDAANRIDDPKTTAAVGAALCVQAEGRLRNFVLRAGRFGMRSTARYIGKMDNSGQIRDENVLLANVDLDGPPTEDVGFEIQFQTATQLGFRQLPIARWAATPLYVLEFTHPDTAPHRKLPLRVILRRPDIDPDKEENEKNYAGREDFKIEEIEDAEGTRLSNHDVRMRLQTMSDGDGYWRDTGRLDLS